MVREHLILNPLSIGYISGQAKVVIDNQSLITGFSIRLELAYWWGFHPVALSTSGLHPDI